MAVTNQKGGVGKTTTTISLASALADEGARVLVVDLDPQGNATTGLGLRGQQGAPSTYRVLVEDMDVEDATEATAVRNLHVVPSSLDLAAAEIELVSAMSREQKLKQALDGVRERYDVILIDCPPSLGLLTINALTAADQVLVPIQCEYYALEGLGQLMNTVRLVGRSLNPELEMGGVVLTMFDGRTNLSQQVVDEVRDHFGDVAYQTIIPRTVRLSEAPSYGQPITVFDPTSRGARAYQRLAREVARRLDLELEQDERSPLDRLLGGEEPAHTPDDTELADRVGAAVPTSLPSDLDELSLPRPALSDDVAGDDGAPAEGAMAEETTPAAPPEDGEVSRAEDLPAVTDIGPAVGPPPEVTTPTDEPTSQDAVPAEETPAPAPAAPGDDDAGIRDAGAWVAPPAGHDGPGSPADDPRPDRPPGTVSWAPPATEHAEDDVTGAVASSQPPDVPADEPRPARTSSEALRDALSSVSALRSTDSQNAAPEAPQRVVAGPEGGDAASDEDETPSSVPTAEPHGASQSPGRPDASDDVEEHGHTEWRTDGHPGADERDER